MWDRRIYSRHRSLYICILRQTHNVCVCVTMENTFFGGFGWRCVGAAGKKNFIIIVKLRIIILILISWGCLCKNDSAAVAIEIIIHSRSPGPRKAREIEWRKSLRKRKFTDNDLSFGWACGARTIYHETVTCATLHMCERGEHRAHNVWWLSAALGWAGLFMLKVKTVSSIKLSYNFIEF